MKIIIAPDSFKGSLTALEAACAMERGVRQVLPDAEIELIPMADGGEGTLPTVVTAAKGQLIEATSLDPLGRSIHCQYGILGNGGTALVEMSVTSGLLLLTEQERNPLYTSTYGTGLLIRHALQSDCRELIIGIGGSSTNDCGTGMAQALGVRFYRNDKTEITDHMCGGLLKDVAVIDISGLHPSVRCSRITVACDVKNPLLGKQGCARVYARQKGATPETVNQLENGMTHFIDVAEKMTCQSVRHIPGAGAAGGLGAGIILFLGGTLEPGADIIMDICHFSERIKSADLILTGEGKIDEQTAYGKTIAGIGCRAKAQKIPVIAFAGVVENVGNLRRFGITHIFSICRKPLSVEAAMADAAKLLQNSVERVLRAYEI